MRFAFLRFFLSFLGVFVFVFVVVYISYVCHTCHNADCIKNRKIMVCKKTSSQFCVLVWYAMRGFEQTLYLVRGYNPSVFSACKTSRKSSSPYTGEPRTALRWLSARLYLTALRSRALSLPQSYCLNPERSPTAPSSEGAKWVPQIPPRCITPHSEFRILTAPSIFCPLGKKTAPLAQGSREYSPKARGEMA